MALLPLSHISYIDSLLSRSQWNTANGQAVNLTYSFPGTGSTNSTFASGITEVDVKWYALSSYEQTQFKAALSAWSEVANLHFNQVKDDSTSQGQIRVAFSQAVATDGSNGWAHYPGTSREAGDVWLSPKLTNFDAGAHPFRTMIHELGHAIGLKHSFEGEPNNSAILTGVHDTVQYSMMAYNSYSGAGYLSDGHHVQPTTPMLYDIAAIQFLYGANMTTRTGNDIYTFSNTTGELKTIWDAGGVDTFDLSNQTLKQTINLNAGQFSSLGGRDYYLDGSLISASNNIAIAYNVTIEKAIGGSGNDTIVGNAVNNTLSGGKGNDTIKGNAGDDVLIGGAGKDNLTGGTGKDIFKFAAVTDSGITLTTRDTIVDFNNTLDFDKIDLSTIDAKVGTGVLAGNQAFSFIGTAAFNAINAAGQVRFDAANHIVYGSNDADATPEFSIFLTGVANLTAADFIL